MWNDIINNSDLEYLLSLVNSFHDSCIKEMKYSSGAFVDTDLSMQPVNTQRKLCMIIQRQASSPSVIELEFSGLKQLKLSPNDENFTAEILGASMVLTDSGIVWCDCDSTFETNISDNCCTKIYAHNVRWRVVDSYIGPESIYINK